MELKKYISKFLNAKRQKSQPLSEKERRLYDGLSQIIGRPIRKVELYQEAFSVRSATQKHTNYERTEFLGDAILGAIVSYYLFRQYPYAKEGYLTQMKSKIVSRKNLNAVGDDLELQQFIQNYDRASSSLSKNISGNLFEALVGAIYLDFGYETCREIILERFLPPHRIKTIENQIISYKSLLLEWAQKRKLILTYQTEECQETKWLSFRSVVLINDEKISNATEHSKKKAEEKAAKRAFYILNKKENILEKN